MNTSGFIDDECNLNDSNAFSKAFRIICPNELLLKYEHHGLHATILDLDVTIHSIYKYNYDKRVNYPFFIDHMPDLSGNIPAYVFMGQF